MSIFYYHVVCTCLHYCTDVKNPCGKQTHSHSCLKLHRYGRFRFMTFNVIMSKLFTFEDVRIENLNTLWVYARQYKQPYFFIWSNQVYYF